MLSTNVLQTGKGRKTCGQSKEHWFPEEFVKRGYFKWRKPRRSRNQLCVTKLQRAQDQLADTQKAIALLQEQLAALARQA